MKRRIVLPATGCRAEDLSGAAQWLRDGGVVAFPTDTFYGLAVDPRSSGAVAALFALKGRPETGALPLVAGSSEQIRRALGGLNETATRLAGRYWPGPLSLLIAAPPEVTDAVHAGTGAVAVRVPANDVATALAHALGYPVTATSANRTGAPPAQRPVELDWLAADPRVYVIDAGETPGGLPSTIVDTRQEPLALVREGAVPWDHVLDFLRA